jgi:hypothetical protein
MLDACRQHPSISRLVVQNTVTNPLSPIKKGKQLQRGWKQRVEAISKILSIPLWAQMRLSVHFFNDTAMDFFRKIHNFEKTPLLQVLISDHKAVDVMHLPLHVAEEKLETVPKSSDCKICHSEVMMKDAIYFCSACEGSVHLTCAARVSSVTTAASSSMIVIPESYRCVCCGRDQVWFDVTTQCIRRRSNSNIKDGSDDDEDGGSDDNNNDNENDDDQDCDDPVSISCDDNIEYID